MQAAEFDAARIPGGRLEARKCWRRSPAAAPSGVRRPGRDIEGGQQQDGEGDAAARNGAGGARARRGRRVSEEEHAAAVAHEMESPQGLAEDRAGHDAGLGQPRGETTSKIAGAAIPPSAASPPIQTAIATTAAKRSKSIGNIIGVLWSVESIDWMPWGAAVFARARAERKPVLLFIGAPWCEASREMCRATYADPAVATLVRDRFVPICVDTDKRPDIAER